MNFLNFPFPALPNPGRYQLSKNVHNITRYQTIAADMQHPGSSPRLYVHVDMNAFYAQVEQLCYNLFGMPVAVGGWRKPDGTVKGIVATSSTELNISTQFELFFKEDERIQRLYQSIDYLNNRFGLDTVAHGISKFDVKGNTHFKERSI